MCNLPICSITGERFSWSCFSHAAGTSGFRQTRHWWECEGALATLPAEGRECRKALHLRSVIAMTLVALALCISIQAAEPKQHKQCVHRKWGFCEVQEMKANRKCLD